MGNWENPDPEWFYPEIPDPENPDPVWDKSRIPILIFGTGLGLILNPKWDLGSRMGIFIYIYKITYI